MENVTIINFPKSKVTAEVIKKSTNGVSINDKESIFNQLVYNAYNKKLNLEIKKLKRTHENDSYPFVMSNKNNRLVVNFEDKNDEYYQKFNKIYLQQKIKKENKIKKIKVFVSRTTATVLTTAAIGGLAYISMKAYDQELEDNLKKIEPYIEQMDQVKHQEEIEKWTREENKRKAEEERKIIEDAINNTNSMKK